MAKSSNRSFHRDDTGNRRTPSVYNPAADLKDTLDSLRVQTVPARLFLVDDGSKFHTDYEALCAGLDARIIRLPKNLGITGAMNAGLTEILKDGYAYIARIDAGDIATPDRFRKQVEFLAAHPEIALLGSAIDFRLLDANGQLLGSNVVQLPTTPEGCRKRLSYNVCASHPSMMIRRTVFETLGGYSENYPAAEDFDLLWRTNNAGLLICNLPDVLLIKDENPGSISQKRRRRQIWSRLRILWANRNLASVSSWLGLGKSLFTLVAPAALINTLKGMKKKRG